VKYRTLPVLPYTPGSSAEIPHYLNALSMDVMLGRVATATGHEDGRKTN